MPTFTRTKHTTNRSLLAADAWAAVQLGSAGLDGVHGRGVSIMLIFMMNQCFETDHHCSFSLPPYLPASASNMNYMAAVYGLVVLLIAVDWSVRGRKNFAKRLLEEH